MQYFFGTFMFIFLKWLFASKNHVGGSSNRFLYRTWFYSAMSLYYLSRGRWKNWTSAHCCSFSPFWGIGSRASRLVFRSTGWKWKCSSLKRYFRSWLFLPRGLFSYLFFFIFCFNLLFSHSNWFSLRKTEPRPQLTYMRLSSSKNRGSFIHRKA